LESKSPDVVSSLVAGLIGATLFLAYAYFSDDVPILTAGLLGFALGIGVQTSVRLTGVS